MPAFFLERETVYPFRIKRGLLSFPCFLGRVKHGKNTAFIFALFVSCFFRRRVHDPKQNEDLNWDRMGPQSDSFVIKKRTHQKSCLVYKAFA